MLEQILRNRRFLQSAFFASAFLFVGAGSASAATIDAATLLGTDFDTYDMGMKVRAVTEDKEAYYVEYGYETFEVADGAWKSVSKVSSMKVTKEALGDQDLGFYAAKQLDEVAREQRVYLKAVQEEERKGEVTRPGDSSEYQGIIGQPLKSEGQTFEGYEPVKPPVEEGAVVANDAPRVLGVSEGAGAEAVAESSVSAPQAIEAVEAAPVADTSALDALASKVASLEEKLQVLTQLVDTLIEFYTNFNLASFLKKDGA